MDPTPPQDEPWGIWHRAASEQVASVLDRSYHGDPFPVLERGRDFANRALRKANPLERAFTESLLEGISKVEAILKDTS